MSWWTTSTTRRSVCARVRPSVVYQRRTESLLQVPSLYLRLLGPGPAGRALSRLACVMSTVPCLWVGLVPYRRGPPQCARWTLRLSAPPCRLLRRRWSLVLMLQAPTPVGRHVLVGALSADPLLYQPRWRRRHGQSRLTVPLCLENRRGATSGSGCASAHGVVTFRTRSTPLRCLCGPCGVARCCRPWPERCRSRP